MCGIGGIFHADPNKSVRSDLLINMAAIQHHRGPDGFGTHIEKEKGVGFCHARLAIIDLKASGNQPLFDHRLMLTHNGEFYDFQRIRALLTADGHTFKTKTDSEIILHLVHQRGFEAMLEELRGEFAFALFDKEEDALYLVRDRFGIKPLYWAEQDGHLVFGSEIKVIFAHPGIPRAFDDHGVFHQLMQAIVPGSTPYKGVHQVKPGHFLKITRKDNRFQVQEKKYWDMDFPMLDDRPPIEEHKAVNWVRESLLEAVQVRLVADVPVGCYLSGGIDSCSILGLAASCRQDPVKAFTIGFDDTSYDESHIATEMAQKVGADQDIMRLDSAHLYDHFEKTHWHTERTIYNTLGVAKYLMSKHVHSVGIKVVMTGEGSDELFAGYPSFRRDFYLHGLQHLPQNQREQLEAGLNKNNALFRGAMLAENPVHNKALEDICGFTPSGLQPWLAAGDHVLDLIHPDIREHLSQYDPGQGIANTLDASQIKGRHPLDISQYVWIKTMLEGQILTWGGDRVDMANSMEARPPFLDHHLAAVAKMIPPELRIKNQREKHVLREAMKGFLPETLYNREKFAFMAPPAHTDPKKMDDLTNLVDRYLRSEKMEILDKNGVEDLLAQYRSPETSRSEKVKMDAIVNHAVGIQILKKNLVDANIPALAQQTAQQIGWAP